jgi:oligoendopeptidase F
MAININHQLHYDARDAAVDGYVQDKDLGALPLWDFDGLYPGDAEAAVAADLQWSTEEIEDFAKAYEGKLASLNAEGLLNAIQRYEVVEERLGRVMSYIGLRYQQKTTDETRAKAMGDAQAQATAATAPLVFFTLEINELTDDWLEERFAQSQALARYRPWFDRLRAFRPHQLSPPLEKFIHDMSVVGSAAWNRLFDETWAGARFTVVIDEQSQSLPLEATLTLLTDSDRKKRAAAATALSSVFRENLRLFTLITNTLAKEKEIEDRWRSLPTPQSSRHLANHIEPAVVDALRDSVVAAYPDLSHRYYALKAKWMGLEKLEIWDRNAPLPETDDRQTPWAAAQDTVLSAYAAFSPDLAALAKRFFDNRWIDAPVTDGKSPGAFAHPTVTSANPYIMLNYLGKTRDVMTLAHELGHGVHQILAAEQGELLSRTPLTLAETASVFGEMLTFKRVLAATDNPARRKSLLAGKVEDMINTVIRQIAFYDFECRVHEARRAGELTADAIGEVWMAVQHESLGPAFNFAAGYENYWVYIPHFIHSPFYVYAYAFGDGLVNALYAVYEEGEDPAFVQKYFEMLRAGGRKGHKALLAPFGLDASDPKFWSKGIGVIAGMIDELETM